MKPDYHSDDFSTARPYDQMTAQTAYELDCSFRPTYHDGTPRKTWEQLGDLERSTWGKASEYRTELTPAGEQAVIPGCEMDAAPGKRQLDLF